MVISCIAIELVWLGKFASFFFGVTRARAQQDFDVSVFNASALAEGVRGGGMESSSFVVTQLGR